MADALGKPYISITPGLQDFYAARGMWADGKPRGALASMLGERTPFGNYTGIVFYVTAEQIGLLTQDLIDNGPRGLNRWQLAQSLRRLRESLKRAGEPLPMSAPAAAPISATNYSAAAPVAGSAPLPFEPLTCPTGGKARAVFEKHAWDCLHAVVDFSQESVYGQEAKP